MRSTTLTSADYARPKPRPWRGRLSPRGFDLVLRRHYGLVLKPWPGPVKNQ